MGLGVHAHHARKLVGLAVNERPSLRLADATDSRTTVPPLQHFTDAELNAIGFTRHEYELRMRHTHYPHKCALCGYGHRTKLGAERCCNHAFNKSESITAGKRYHRSSLIPLPPGLVAHLRAARLPSETLQSLGLRCGVAHTTVGELLRGQNRWISETLLNAILGLPKRKESEDGK